MNLNRKRKSNKMKKQLLQNWFMLMKPLATYLDKRENKKYEKYRKTATKEQVVKALGDYFLADMVKRDAEIKIVDAKRDAEVETGYKFVRDIDNYFRLKKRKDQIAFHKYREEDDLTEQVINYMKSNKGVEVKEYIEEFKYDYYKPEGYKKTYQVGIASNSSKNE